MSAVQIAGCSGAGKSALAAVLARRSLVSIDADNNQQELADRFTRVFLLEIDEPTMLARLDARRDYHDWGHIGDTREYLRRKLPSLQDRLRASGAIPVDARQPLDQVADAIVSRMLAAAPPDPAARR
jgi:thymidylate kinase